MEKAPEKKKFKISRQLATVLIVSAAVHVLAALILGGLTIVRYVLPDDVQFEEPPVNNEEPPPPEVKVEIKPRPNQSNDSLQNLKLQQIKNITVPDLDLDMPNMGDNFTVSVGMGGFSSGNLLGGASGALNLQMSNVSIFGLKTKAERILFLVDASRHMLTDAKGGLYSYEIIKKEITSMVENLGTGTLFNVGFYERDSGKLFKPELSPAGMEVATELQNWVAPINESSSNLGLFAANTLEPQIRLESDVLDSILHYRNRGNENARLTQFSIEQGIDAIFIITGFHSGFHKVRRHLTEQEEADWEHFSTSSRYLAQLEEHEQEKAEMEQRIREKLAEINEERADKGLPPKILSGQWGIYSNADDLDLKWETRHPGFKPTHYFEADTLESYFDTLVKEIYATKGRETPSINIVLFLAEDEEFSKEEEKSLKDYVRYFDGKYRIIRGLEEIRRAASAADTVN